MNFVTKHSLLNAHRDRFQESYSIIDALLRVSDFLNEHLNKGEKSIAVFSDLAKAFDRVNHNIRINKIE